MESILRVIFLLPLILSTAFLPRQATAEEITKTCESAVNKQLCISSLKAVPGSQTASVSGLAEMAINLALQKGTAIVEDVKKLVANTTDSFNQPRLNDCLENYTTAVDQLEDAHAAMKSKGYSDVATWIQSAMTDAETCEDGFGERPGHSSMIKDQNVMFQQLCGNALAIVNVLAGGD